MLDYTILKNKGKLYLNKPDGTSEQYVDLLTKSCKEFESSDVDAIIVNEHYVARPDLISLAVYGTDEYADIICKYNGISNPFELNENDVILLPDYTTFEKMIELEDNKTSVLATESKKFANKAHKNQKSKTDRRSPSQSIVGDEPNFVIDKTLGIVFY